jgi:hypothetical protein|tara:strand:+ start:2176 stop:2358 length:183 start_codon:yes stop_codon:yes gene_type:complete
VKERMKMAEVMVIVNREYLERLEKDAHFLECLDAVGVEAWDGMEEALEMYEEECGHDRNI